MTGHPKPPKRAKGPVPRATMALLTARSRGRCEACHLAPATEAHHRKYRGRGGTHDIENLLHLCGWGNHTGCHGIAHTGKGQERGLSVSGFADPAGVPFEDDYGVKRELLADGTKREVRPVVETITSDEAEERVGVDRLEFIHVGLASAAEGRVYVLHSARCLRIRQELREELTECVYSLALAGGVDADAWRAFEDEPVTLEIVDGRLVPGARRKRRDEVGA